ncbi:unnamed protein product [Tetraodon nigroviridis]|uniref:Chromosome 20 SCAF14744, whole genome shotgun sequence n=1 Tax=Tetraodon nigroviridis TaxID=99883 RepID=Q4S428_TETNG|nr:unnamed protein product [Tetraodon nigroviridis]
MAWTGLLVLELGLYAGSFCCGIITAASVAIVQGNFGGRCILYGHVNYSANLIGVQSAASPSLCYFVSAISVIVAVVCFSLSLYWLYAFCIDGDTTRERIWMNVIIALSGAFLFFLLVTGCVLKIGRDSLCSSVTSVVPNVTSCENAQNKSWASPIKGGRFYNSLLKAEGSDPRPRSAGEPRRRSPEDGHKAGDKSVPEVHEHVSGSVGIGGSERGIPPERRQEDAGAVPGAKGQLSVAATQLRVESAALREQCEASQLDMARIHQSRIRSQGKAGAQAEASSCERMRETGSSYRDRQKTPGRGGSKEKTPEAEAIRTHKPKTSHGKKV